MINIFTYGSLMFSPVWQHVVKGHYHARSGRASGVARYSVNGTPYPGCIFEKDSSTAGVVYFNVSTSDCSCLDQFEGEHYARCNILVELETGQSICSWLYIYKPVELLSDHPWDPLHFERKEMKKFLATYTPTRTTSTT